MLKLSCYSFGEWDKPADSKQSVPPMAPAIPEECVAGLLGNLRLEIGYRRWSFEDLKIGDGARGCV